MTVEHPAPMRAVTRSGTELTLEAHEFEVGALVTAKTYAATGIVTLELRRTDGGPFPPWQPGAHIDLVLGAAPTRQYSLAVIPPTSTLGGSACCVTPTAAAVRATCTTSSK